MHMSHCFSKFFRISIALPGFAIILFLSPACFASSGADTDNFKVQEVADGVFVHKGRHVPFEADGSDDIANIGFIIGERCVAVIDTGGSVTMGEALLQSIRRKTDKPVCYVINSHIHFDHVLGNIAFKSTAARFIGHRDLADEILANKDFFLQQYAGSLGDKPDADSIVGPDILVENELEIDLGQRTLVLKAYETAHSHTDLSVFDEKTSTLWLSDLLFVERIPSLDGSLRKWLSVLAEFEQSPAQRLIPGHGPISVEGPTALKRQRQYLQMLLDQTREQITRGSFMEDIVEQVGRDEKQSWLLHEQHHKRNVTKAFSELEWE